MSSRLDRLLVLLDTGSNNNVRGTAAKQIAQLAVKSVRSDVPDDEWDVKQQTSSSTKDSGEYAELMAVVGRILPYLHSKSFDTRTAASTALSHICVLLPVWAPPTCSAFLAPSVDSSSSPPFPPFSVSTLIDTPSSSLLLGSSGKEYAKPAAFRSPAEVAKARKEAMGRLGLDFLGMGDEPDPEMDWDKELADGGGDGEASGMVDTKVESLDVEMCDAADPEVNRAQFTRDITPKGEDLSKSVKMEVSSESTYMCPPFINTDGSHVPPPPPSDAMNTATPSLPRISKFEEPEASIELSARERNRLKRKRKAGTSAFVAGAAVPVGGTSSNGNNGPSGPPPPPKGSSGKYSTVTAGEGNSKVRLTAPTGNHSSRLSPPDENSLVGTSSAPEKVVIDPSRGGQVEAHDAKDDSKALTVREGEWIWEGVRSVLEVDLFSPSWEVRHGAAMGLRDIIKSQGKNGAAGVLEEENQYLHEKWCNDLAAKFLCILVLDRFGDFVSDQVVAPVRETVSQTLAALLIHMPRRSISHVHEILLEMIKQDSARRAINGSSARTHVWEVRHAGLLGIKYEVAVRGDLVEDSQGEGSRHILRGVVETAVLGLGDHDDDVRAVAASCLLPVASQIVRQLPDHLSGILGVLWNCLSNMKDDLSSSVGAVMELLGQLVTYDEVIQVLGDPTASRPLSTLAPLLFPFFRHAITNVRLAVVKTLHSFLEVVSLPRDWITDIFLRLLMQNLIVEEKEEIRDVTLATWRTAVQVLSRLTTGPGGVWLEWIVTPELVLEWHEVVMTPLGTPVDISKFYSPSSIGHEGSERHNIDKNMLNQDFALVSQELILKGRVAAATAIATLINAWPTERQEAMFGGLLQHYIVSASMLQRLLTATIVEEWAREAEKGSSDPPPLASFSPFADNLGQTMLTFLDGPTPEFYHEMALSLTRLLQDCTSLLTGFFSECKVAVNKIPSLGKTIDITGRGEDPDAFTLEKARMAVGAYFQILKSSLGRTKKKEVATLEDRRKLVVAAITQYETTKTRHDTRVSAAFAAAVVALRIQMPKLTPVIKSLTAGVRSEDNIDLQLRSAKAVAAIVDVCSRLGTTPPLQKIVKNLCAFLCQDTEFTPTFSSSPTEGILSFKQESVSSPHRAVKDKDSSPPSEEVIKARLTRRGAHLAFVELSARFGPSLFEILPAVWECMCGSLIVTYQHDVPDNADDEMQGQTQKGQDVIDNLVILDAITPTFHEQLWPRLYDLFPHLVLALRSRFAVVRQLAAQAFGTICDVSTSQAMRYVIDHVIGLMGDPVSLTNRQGAIELIYHIVRKLDLKALPYVIFMVVPVLGRMSDQNDDIRATATNTFASLVKMVPLEAGLPDPPGFPEELLQKRVSEREFLTQLLDGSKVEHYHIPVPITIELRKYQQEGVNWLAFLAKYQLHGILCDDMGLGKTLQSICILAGKHHERMLKFKATESPDSVHLPSIVICPPTLTGHWSHEITKYTTNLKPITYVGPVKERAKLLSTLDKYDVVITSYEVVRNDVANLAHLNWHYCILDEGHVIKNAKTKLTKAVKTLRAQHRLVLSGTPIQNNVLELWSLFDFLMPGFLGSETSFYERFGKPILSTRDGKASAKNNEAAALALEALHKQVLPFLLRRLKEDVLDDLPPKIIQDYYCELSDLQKRLYDDFAQSKANNIASDAVKTGESAGQQHVFQSLQYLRKLCNHPALVLKDNLSAIDDILQTVQGKGEKSSLHDLQHAPKLQALRQLLLDCGIGSSTNADLTKGDLEEDPVSGVNTFSQHRVLIFCQLKQMLDIIEMDLFKKHMPSVTYMRLDGGTDPGKRHAIVQTFNGDPSIDVLLLTTHVGGLGLTLTGADTVIFVEHDWNPMKDLQAMDRAHRLGQKKVVNVYRLITKGTLEEKIMGLQRFKLNIASSIITQQNSGLASMDTDLVLDLFRRTTETHDATTALKKDSTGPVSQKNVLDGLEELPAEDEYDGLELSNFIGSLGR
ncbi:SNF2 chromatin remodeling protein [Hysterangium stoloniferum]|nr:SNF2 chromatin remodeling protein [Hysterangium stoloniferum]